MIGIVITLIMILCLLYLAAYLHGWNAGYDKRAEFENEVIQHVRSTLNEVNSGP